MQRLEDGAEAVVVGLVDGVVFVIVALHALHREAEEGAAGVLDGFIKPGGAVEEVVAAGEEAGSTQHGAILRRELVGRELLDDHAVIAFVGIEAFDDPVTPVPEMFLRMAELGTEAIPIAVAPDVHEVACPAFAELGGGEQTIYQGLIGKVGWIGQIRWEAGEIEMDAAEPDIMWRGGLRFELLRGEVCGVEDVDALASAFWHLIGPVGTRIGLGLFLGEAGRPGGEPFTHFGHLLGTEHRAFAFGRHAVGFVGAGEAVEQVLRGIAVVATGFQQRDGIEAEAGFLFQGPMAGVAPLFEQRLDVLRIVHRHRGGGESGEDEAGGANWHESHTASVSRFYFFNVNCAGMVITSATTHQMTIKRSSMPRAMRWRFLLPTMVGCGGSWA